MKLCSLLASGRKKKVLLGKNTDAVVLARALLYWILIIISSKDSFETKRVITASVGDGKDRMGTGRTQGTWRRRGRV